ncbi:RloB family protein [Burkholderia cepacia]|uniref:RloB family protein n=1 Tax=Burkholderia cepacia TaxID=292 RepID=UPI003D67DF80
MICEDKKSGKRYIQDAAYHFRVDVMVEVAHVGKTDPKGIVEEAMRQLKKYDRVFCAIDRDTHETWDQALALAKTMDDIHVIGSFPCLEFWFILHFNKNRKPYAREGNKSPGECCVSDLKKCKEMGGYAKGGDGEVFKNLLPNLDVARANSLRVLREAEKDNEFNPSTRMHELIDFLEALEKEFDS